MLEWLKITSYSSNILPHPMEFREFADDVRVEFDEATLHLLQNLQTRFGRVEFRQIAEKECCVRVWPHANDSTPIAAIGPTYYESVRRLTRILQ